MRTYEGFNGRYIGKGYEGKKIIFSMAAVKCNGG
jgi:hypothetical protein